MTPGFPLLLHCPHCNKQVAQPTLMSGNTFGATLWSDAKQEAPMLPHYPDLIRCPHCEALFRASTATKAENQPKSYESDFPSPPELTEDDWLNALDKNLFESERYGRIGAWHAANDKRRGKETLCFDFSPRAVQNLVSLRELLVTENDAQDQIIVSEIYRELKQFDESLQLLSELAPDDELASICEQIRTRAKNEDDAVFQLTWS